MNKIIDYIIIAFAILTGISFTGALIALVLLQPAIGIPYSLFLLFLCLYSERK